MKLAFDVTMILVAFVIWVLLLFLYYKYVGWTAFSYKRGDVVLFTNTNPKDNITNLRFKNCIFTVTLANGKVGTRDVTSNLIAMATAYNGSIIPSLIPSVLQLDDALSPYSFTIVGFNDNKATSDPTDPNWSGATVTLTGSWKII